MLEIYGKALRQLINMEKSSVFFNKNVKEKQKEKVLKELKGMKQIKQSRYFGLPIVISRSKQQVFNFIREKIMNRLKGWKEKLLNQDGKEILLKSIILVLHV